MLLREAARRSGCGSSRQRVCARCGCACAL